MESNGMKVRFDKFDGKESFTMWKVRMKNLLVYMGLDSTLEDRSEGMTNKQWVSLEKRHIP